METQRLLAIIAELTVHAQKQQAELQETRAQRDFNHKIAVDQSNRFELALACMEARGGYLDKIIKKAKKHPRSVVSEFVVKLLEEGK